MSAVFRPLAEDEFVDAAGRYADGANERVLTELHRTREPIEQDLSRMMSY